MPCRKSNISDNGSFTRTSPSAARSGAAAQASWRPCRSRSRVRSGERRRPPADLVGFDENDLRARLGGMQGGRASGDAAAHDRHVGALVAGERSEPERRSRAGAVGRVRRPGIVVQGKVHGLATVRHFQVCRTGRVARRMVALQSSRTLEARRST
jgi:hypothetical protein